MKREPTLIEYGVAFLAALYGAEVAGQIPAYLWSERAMAARGSGFYFATIYLLAPLVTFRMSERDEQHDAGSDDEE